MRIIKLRTSQPNTFWFMDNIQLTPFEDTSPPFDFDLVYEEGRQRIYSAANVTGRIEIIDIPPTKDGLMNIIPDNKPVYELPNQQYQYVPRTFSVPLEDELAPESDDQEIIAHATPDLDAHIEPTEEDLKAARKLLTSKVQIIEAKLDALPKTKETRRFLLACIRVEGKNKKRKSVCDFLETSFLAIPPEGE